MHTNVYYSPNAWSYSIRAVYFIFANVCHTIHVGIPTSKKDDSYHKMIKHFEFIYLELLRENKQHILVRKSIIIKYKIRISIVSGSPARFVLPSPAKSPSPLFFYVFFPCSPYSTYSTRTVRYSALSTSSPPTLSYANDRCLSLPSSNTACCMQ